MTSITPFVSTPTVSAVTPLRGATSDATAPTTTPVAASTAGGAGTPTGFSESVDSKLGITVLKFFGSTGDVTQSFPSQKQLASYQLYGLDKGAGSSSSSTTSGAAGTIGAPAARAASGSGATVPAPHVTGAPVAAGAAPATAAPVQTAKAA